MIFVSVGTTAFDSLVKAIDDSGIKEEIIIQKADGSYVPKNYEYIKYCTNLLDYFQRAELVITHGGTGNIFQLLNMDKKIIGVANNDRDDLHQKDILEKLSKENYLIWCQDIKNIKSCVEDANKIKLKKYEKEDSDIAKSISEFILG